MKKYFVSVLTFVIGYCLGYKKEKNVKRMPDADILAKKHLAIMLLYDQWLKTKQEGKKIENYFFVHGYKKIAIYGFSYVGERLYDELKDTGIEIGYIIDKMATNICAEIDVITPEMEFEKVDAIVVTSNYYYNDIKNTLSLKVDWPIINLEDILYEI